MTFDFHTHAFPDRVAPGAIASLAEKGGIPPCSDGTVAGLSAAIREAGIDVAVNLPVLTSPAQFDSVLRFAEGICAGFAERRCGVLSFAGAHPALADTRGCMRRVREAGILGVKIHPEYQDTFIDDDAYYRLLSAAKEEGLITVMHAGVDIAYRDREMRASPARTARLLDRLGGYPRLVLAHLGGEGDLAEVEARLLGREVYLDTAFVLPRVSREVFLRILSRHGAHRLLFASDSPWQSPAACLRALGAMGIPEATERMLLSENPAALLGL